MDKKEVLKIINKIKIFLEEDGYRVKKIILFGSYAKGAENIRDDSDIDMIIISDDFHELGYWERVKLIVRLLKQLFYPIDIYFFTMDEWNEGESMIIDYAKNGEEIFIE